MSKQKRMKPSITPSPSKLQPDLETELDPIIKEMVSHGIPLTREAYLAMALPGVEEPLDAELEAELPERFRHNRAPEDE
jgi:hypothetical protein